jgi:hypothetical protein
MLHDENKIARILFLKETVSQFLCFFSEYGEVIDNLRNLMEKETGVSDIPLEWYEKTRGVFLDLVFPNEENPTYYYELYDDTYRSLLELEKLGFCVLGKPSRLDGPAIILPE